MWKRGFRDEIWSRLDQPWDLIVVGGGITGAGVLGEAVRQGKRALLVEAQDFASGTSSRSTKLVHGGLRYLRQGQFLQTHQCVRERERLISEGAGLVNRVSFSLGSFPGDGMPKWLYGVGLALYDAIAWKWAHETLSREQLLSRFDPLAGSTVEGGYQYVDGQVDDARLVMRVLREAVQHGGTAINYVKAEQLLRTADGQVRGVVLRDAAAGSTRTAEVKANVVINATGAWADELRGKEQPRRLRKIRGSHLVFRADRLPLAGAFSFLHPRDRRAVFAIPWEGVVIAGTTDVDHDQTSNEPAITTGETEYILESLHRAFPSLALTAKDAFATYSGVRPVIDTGKADPSKESREHVVWSENGLVTITGGKLTTFALMARKALWAARGSLGEMRARTRVFDANPEGIAWPSSIAVEDRFRLLGRFGADAADLAADTANVQRIDGSIALWSELRHAARNEAVLTLSDLLLRRVRLGLLLPNGGLDQATQIRSVAQPELGWDDARWDAEEAAYRSNWKSSYGPIT